MAEHLPGPAHLVLLAAVARRYYLDGRSKIEIAHEFDLSRFKVARLLDEARAYGLVRIEIRHPGAVDVNLSVQLRERFGLQHAVVVDTADEDPLLLRGHVGRAAADLLTEIVTGDDVLGLGWARSLLDMTAALRTLPPCAVVQLTGALSRADVDASSIEIVRHVAAVAKGPAYFFYAPMILPDATTAAALLGQPDIARAVARFPDVTKAVVAIGGWDPPYSTVYDAISPAERRGLVELGVRADVSGVLLDGEGRAVDAPLSRRMICIKAAQLQRVPEVIALAYDVQKTEAVRAAVQHGYVNGLVTHTTLAEALVGAPPTVEVAAVPPPSAAPAGGRR
jgi:DNA-binding transcriptional regulator LsrR (DeoR family)